MLDKIVYEVDNSDIPRQLLQSVLEPFLYIGAIICKKGDKARLYVIDILTMKFSTLAFPLDLEPVKKEYDH
jgi:hypothetical protein